MNGHPENVPPEQPEADWAEQHTDVEPVVEDREADVAGDGDSDLSADAADMAEQSRAVDDDEPYPHE